jgi:hypothetical protein
MSTTSEAVIFGRVLESDREKLPVNVARYILRLGFRPEDRERMHQLAEKARAGTLTPAEQEEIDNYDRVGHLLSVLKSRARKALKKASNGS